MLINKKANTGRWAGCRARGRAAAGPLGARALAGWGTWHRQVASRVWRGGGGERLLYYGIAARTRQSQQRELEERSTAT